MVIRDYIFEPRRDLYLFWAGRFPPSIYLDIHQLIRDIFGVPDSHILEMVFDWDAKPDGAKFKIGWRVIKEFDIYSYLRLDINVVGNVEGERGKFSMTLKPRFFTEYPQDTIFQQTVLYEILRRAWHVLYYERKIQEYKEESRIMVMQFHKKVKELLESYSAVPPSQSQ